MPAEDRGTKDEDRDAPVRSLYGLDGRRLPDGEADDEAHEARGSEPPPPAPPAFDPQTLVVEGRRSMVRSFRQWWHEESLARAAEKRAKATAEAILRAQAIQAASAPVDHAPSQADREQSLQSVLALTEERFQALGVRSDRVRDELAGISRALGMGSDRVQDQLTGISQGLEHLRAIVVEAGSEPVAEPATQIIADLEVRLDGLRGAVVEELGRQADQMEERVSAMMRLQTAELATLLGDAVIRIRGAIPDELEQVRVSFASELEQVRSSLVTELEPVRTLAEEVGRAGASSAEALAELAEKIPDGVERLLGMMPEELRKLRADHAAEMERRAAVDRGLMDGLADRTVSAVDRMRETFEEEIQALRELNREDGKRLRATHGEEMVRLRVANAGELERMHRADEETYLALRDLMAEAIERLRATSAEELARLRAAIPEGVERLRTVHEEELERLRSFNSQELERMLARGKEEIARIRTADHDRLVEVHDVLASGMRHLREAIDEPLPERDDAAEPLATPVDASELLVAIPEVDEVALPDPLADPELEEIRADTASVLDRLRAENEAALAHLRAALAE